MPCSSGEDIGQPCVGHGREATCAVASDAESSTDVATRIARSVFVSRYMEITDLASAKATDNREYVQRAF